MIKLQNAWSWIKDKWNKFEAEVYSVMPGFKTKLCTALGAVGSVSALLQQYITGLPLDKFATGTQVAVLTFVLFTLAFWFHDMGERVASTPTESS